MIKSVCDLSTQTVLYTLECVVQQQKNGAIFFVPGYQPDNDNDICSYRNLFE